MTFVVAIDGPAGTGKSSAARSLAKKLNFIYVDTGAIYRALAYLVDRYQADPEDAVQVVALVPKITVQVDAAGEGTCIVVDNIVLQDELRSEHISRLSSVVSQHQRVREALLPVQRDLIKKIPDGAIFEGRDIGTVVFPRAPLKIFVTANSETRAKRRYEELINDKKDADYDDVLLAIQKRDERDQTRKSAPMQKAVDAHVIDTSHMSLEDVIDEALALIKAAQTIYKGQPLW